MTEFGTKNWLVKLEKKTLAPCALGGLLTGFSELPTSHGDSLVCFTVHITCTSERFSQKMSDEKNLGLPANVSARSDFCPDSSLYFPPKNDPHLSISIHFQRRHSIYPVCDPWRPVNDPDYLRRPIFGVGEIYAGCDTFVSTPNINLKTHCTLGPYKSFLSPSFLIR